MNAHVQSLNMKHTHTHTHTQIYEMGKTSEAYQLMFDWVLYLNAFNCTL